MPTQIINKLSGSDQPLPFESEIPTSGNKFTEILFGGKPVRTLTSTTENIKKIISPYIGDKFGSLSALPLAVAGIALDLSGFGGKASVKSFSDEIPEAFLKYVAKEKNPAIIEDTLKTIGLDDIRSAKLSKELAPTGTVDEVKNVLLNFENKTKIGDTFKNILSSGKRVESKIPPTGRETPEEILALAEKDAKIKHPSVSSPTTPEEASSRYYNEVIKPKVQKGEAQVLGADDMKDYFGKDYDPTRHQIYSKAAFDLYNKAVKESSNPIVKFTVGGTGSGKSSFLVPGLSESFDGVIYDSTGYNYDGIKKQIDYAKQNGKTPEIHAIIPDLSRARAYTFLREMYHRQLLKFFSWLPP